MSVPCKLRNEYFVIGWHKMKHAKQIILSFCFLAVLLLVSIKCSDNSVNSVEPSPDYTLSVSPEGGDYSYPGGISLRVPAGAVTDFTAILLRKVPNSELSSIFEKRGVSINNLLACVEGSPDGIAFNIPVQLVIAVDLEPGEIPFVHEIDLNNGTYMPLETDILYDPDQDTLIISLTHFSSISAEIIKEFEDFLDNCGENPCRCVSNKIEQRDVDLISENGDCQITETKVSITFLDCPGSPVEESFFREVSAGCNPNLNLSAASTEVPFGGQTNLTAEIMLGIEPMVGQDVDFSISGPASLNPTNTITNAEGAAYSTFTAADEEGLATVTARATVSYSTYTISASSGDLHESEDGPLITKELSQSINIEVFEPEEIWSGTMTYDFINYITVLTEGHYSVNFQFSVIRDPYSESIGDIVGIATATQEITLSILADGWYFQNLNAPSTLNLVIHGTVGTEDTLYLAMEKPEAEDENFFSYETCMIGYPEDVCSETTLLTSMLIGNTFFGDNGNVLLREGTYSGSYGYGEPVLHSVSYTITLNQDQ